MSQFVTPVALENYVNNYCSRIKNDAKLAELYRNCALATVKTSLQLCDDGTVFVLTGDIPAMWLRDSAAQVSNYIPVSHDPEVGKIIEGVIRRQLKYIQIDSYANAFNILPNGEGHIDDHPKQGPWVFERKYEVDSLCYPMRLLYLYWKHTGKTEIIYESLETVSRLIVSQFRNEQHHDESSPYRFTRDNPGVPWETIYNEGLGTPVAFTGMTWSGFRPSDDGCEYGYPTASEMFAVVTLKNMAEMLLSVINNEVLAFDCEKLSSEIDGGINKYSVIEHEKYGKMYVCETDGLGHCVTIDDANVPSLLSAPYIGYCNVNDPVYENTRAFLLSKDNPYYFSGKTASGIGSRHTPENYIWHMSLIMQGLTSSDNDEKLRILQMLKNTDGGRGYMHESFDADDPSQYTRDWFTWPCSLFAEFVEKCVDEGII